MKKLLKLLFVLTGATTLPATVIACNQESLDSNLNLILNGETKYDIEQFGYDKQTEAIKDITFTKDQTDKIVKKIVETIFQENEIDTKIPWYDETPENNKKCYNFDVKDVNLDEKNQYTWDVQNITGRITIKISYLVGTTNSEHNFVAHQKIDKSVAIKVAYTESDYQLKAWIDEFNNTFDWYENPLEIDLSDIKVDLPVTNTSWSSLDKKIVLKTNEVIYTKLNKLENKKVNAWSIKSTDENITSDNKLKLQISANLDEAVGMTKTFYIKLFKK